MRVLVTGVAGFIGSSVAEGLLAAGHEVLGIDSFVDYYPRRYKERNLASLRGMKHFKFVEADLATVAESFLLDSFAEYPFVSHQAAQAGVRSSWGHQFGEYIHNNISATQKLLEVARRVPIKRFVYASSSSVYGQANVFPLCEEGPALPVSPYGVTKLAAEHLARLYHRNYGIPTISLRYFTVYGPKQRPDMAFHRMIRSTFTGEAFPLYGDGTQSRNFTYITDIVEANIAALGIGGETGGPSFLGDPINIGGGERATVNQVIALIEELTGRRLLVQREAVQKGDVDRTEADATRASKCLGFVPTTSLKVGLANQISWMRDLLRDEGLLP